VTDGSTIKTTEYLDDFQYENQLLQFFPHAEGYVRVTTNSINPTNPQYSYNYAYNYTDHLGDIRLTYAKDPQSGNLKVMEENHYYPFGLKHQNYTSAASLDFQEQLAAWGVILAPVSNNPFKYKYNGKELQDELGLGLYDYGARLYDPALGRWSVPDPLAEKFYPSSPYSYTVNNPVLLNDPDGRDWAITFQKDDNGKWNINITVNAAVVNNSDKKIDIKNYIKEQTAQFERIFSYNSDEFCISATMNLRAVDSEDDVKGSEHLIAIGNPSGFGENEAGNSDIGGLRVDMNSKYINEDGTTEANHALSHEVGHTGGLIHPFEDPKSVGFYDGYSPFTGYRTKEAPLYNQLLGVDVKTNFMSYPQKYYNINASTKAGMELKKVFANPGTATIGQLGAIFKYYNSGLLNKDNR